MFCFLRSFFSIYIMLIYFFIRIDRSFVHLFSHSLMHPNTYITMHIIHARNCAHCTDASVGKWISLIDWAFFIHGLLHFSGLYQFIDVVVCGEHSRLLGIGETGAFFMSIMAVLSVLTVSSCTHILEETQYLHIIRCWFPQFIQLSVK